AGSGSRSRKRRPQRSQTCRMGSCARLGSIAGWSATRCVRLTRHDRGCGSRSGGLRHLYALRHYAVFHATTPQVHVVRAKKLLFVLQLFILACGASIASAQQEKAPDIKYLIPEKLERATKADEQGLLQWAEYDKPKCQTCAGTGKTKCSTCWRFV